MNWHRGFLLAGSQLAAALPQILFLEARDAEYIREIQNHSTFVKTNPTLRNALFDRSQAPWLIKVQEGETVTFDPCHMWVHYGVQEEVVRMANMPAAALTGWRLVCPADWTLSALLKRSGIWRMTTHAEFAAQRRIDVVLCLLIVLQWFLVGGFPLRRPRRWWGEPGAFITACFVIASLISVVKPIGDLARFPALGAAFGWFWWFGLLVWIIVRFEWRSAIRLRSRQAH